MVDASSEIEPHQYSLGELIEALKAADPNAVVRYGFGNPHSYRGYYDELAFEPVSSTTVAAMLAAAESAMGTTYQGWKGGDFKMDSYTSVWLSTEGSGNGETMGRLLLALMLGHAE